MSVNAVPVLGTQSFVTDPANKFNQLMTDIFTADANQSQLYNGHITSLSDMYQRSAGDPNSIPRIFGDALKVYLSRYYDNVNVNVVVSDTTPDIAGDGLDIKIIAQVYENEQEQVYGYLLKSQNGALSNLIRINNYGG